MSTEFDKGRLINYERLLYHAPIDSLSAILRMYLPKSESGKSFYRFKGTPWIHKDKESWFNAGEGGSMSQDLILSFGSNMLTTASMLAAPILLTSLLVGLIVGVVQVATQIQEMTLTFVPKIIAAVTIVLVMGGWMLSLLAEYARETILLSARAGL